MAENKNALAELAERMAVVTSGHGDTWRWLEDVSKAQRIVAELAKVEELRMALAKEKPASSKWFGRFARLCNAQNGFFKKCRAIAEEGEEK